MKAMLVKKTFLTAPVDWRKGVLKTGGNGSRRSVRRSSGSNSVEVLDLRVVKHEIHASPLLHHLERSAEDRATEIRAGVEERTSEAGCVRREPASRGNRTRLVLSVGDNLGELELDVVRRRGLAAETDEGVARLVELAALDVETRRVGEEEETDSKDDGPGEL